MARESSSKGREGGRKERGRILSKYIASSDTNGHKDMCFFF